MKRFSRTWLSFQLMKVSHFIEPKTPTAKYSKAFQADFYKSYYTDLHDLSAEDAALHYHRIGQREQRYPNKVAFLRVLERETRPLPADFDGAEYLELNPELKSHLKRDWEPMFHYMRYGRWEGRKYKKVEYTKDLLDVITSSVYDMPQVALDTSRKPTINVLVPAFDFGSMSAGFFGVFQVALFIKRCGFPVRLVLFDRFHFDKDLSKQKLRNYPGLENLFDELEVAYIGDRSKPLRVHPNDNSVATVWYSAYLARKIADVVDNKRFLYLIQDYETVFHPSSTSYALADASYSFNYAALFSTEVLQSFFKKNKVGLFGTQAPKSVYFNNACASSLGSPEAFRQKYQARPRRRLAFYSRPVVHRNMFELGALALITAYQQGVFAKGEWEFYGIGLGEAVIRLGDGVELTQLPRMNLRDYQDMVSNFDVGLCLMASSHPSLLPFDLSGSGAVVVTNSFGEKDQSYFDPLAPGVIVSSPGVPELVEALRQAVTASADIDARHRNASAMAFPRTWGETFKDEHRTFIRDVFATSLPATRKKTPSSAGIAS